MPYGFVARGFLKQQKQPHLKFFPVPLCSPVKGTVMDKSFLLGTLSPLVIVNASRSTFRIQQLLIWQIFILPHFTDSVPGPFRYFIKLKSHNNRGLQFLIFHHIFFISFYPFIFKRFHSISDVRNSLSLKRYLWFY